MQAARAHNPAYHGDKPYLTSGFSLTMNGEGRRFTWRVFCWISQIPTTHLRST